MRQKKTSRPAAAKTAEPRAQTPYPLLVWLVFAAGSLFFLPPCLDRYLAPRFLFVSAALLAALFMVRKDLREHADWRLHAFDLLLLAWYGMNLASVGWAFSWSEAIFYTQKVLLLFLTYWLFRQALASGEKRMRDALRQATTLLTYAVGGILVIQMGFAISEYGLDNQHLYDYTSAVFGNKSLASDFLFFLLIFNGLFYRQEAAEGRAQRRNFRIAAVVLLGLILLLQTRTVYLAVVAAALFYATARSVWEPGFFNVFKRKTLPVAAAAVLLLAAWMALKGPGGSLSERLNPLTYLESGTANERRFVWYKTDLLNADHFWLGVGNGSWKIWFPSKNLQGAYRLQEQNVVFTRTHNDYLEVRSEMGIIGVVLFCALFAAALLAALAVLRKKDTGSRERHDLIVLTAGLLGYCVIQFLDFPRERIECQVVLALFFAYIAFHTRTWWAQWPGVGLRRLRVAFLWAAAAGLLFNGLIGWKRVQGEIHNVKLLQAQARRDYQGLLTEAQAAQNAFYEYNDVVLPLAWYEGVAYYQMEQTERAIEAFGRSYLLNPWSFQVINNYASALVKGGQYAKAVPLFEKALEINPRFEDGKFNLSYVWYQLGDYSKALDWLNRVDTVANPQTDEARLKNAQLLNQKTDFRKTIEEKMK